MRIPAQQKRDGVLITALREISILRSIKHANIVNVVDVALGDEGMDDVYMVMDYCEQVGDVLLRYTGIKAHLAGLPSMRLHRRRMCPFG